ncbi:hypothetical protein BGY98DRAFT_935249 [Russula aff. rugulosa BPL654]|nr:hypothetical protein BGY98DRAFT_935249 [Russula aff. rugulosa BPL654]
MYIPFASLLGLQAAIAPHVLKQPACEPETASLNGSISSTLNREAVHSSTMIPDPGLESLLTSPWVLADGGFVHFANAIGFGIECFGAHLGAPQTANLGDGNGWVNQTMELRNDYGNPDIGTCWESLVGGNHLRMWHQNGASAHTNALFLAVSEEENVSHGHTIAKDGYNRGRDSLVKSALKLKKYRGVKYHVDAQKISGLIAPGSTGINHGIATDGIVVLLTVTIENSLRYKY